MPLKRLHVPGVSFGRLLPVLLRALLCSIDSAFGPDGRYVWFAQRQSRHQYNNVFPNFHPWGAFSLIVYRFRPYGDDPNMSIHEVMYLVPWPEGQPKPPAAKIHWLGPDENWTDAQEMGPLGRVLNQDSYNLPKVQAGMKTKEDPYIYFSAYAEGKIRHFHHLWDQWMATE